MKIHVYYPKENEEHLDALKAMQVGIPGSDWRPLESYSVKDAPDVAVVFGVYKRAVPYSAFRGRVLEVQKYLGKQTLVVEKGFVDRDAYFSVGWGGLNGRADFRNEGSPDYRRTELAVDLKPWDLSGENFLIIGQVPWDASVEHTNFFKWLAECLIHMKRLSDTPIVFRPHPKAVGDFSELYKEIASYGVAIAGEESQSLSEALNAAKAVITFNSNTGVDAVIAGKPVITFDAGSMVWNITKHHLEYLLDPGLLIAGVDRTQWLNDLAYSQWTLGEMSDGQPWRWLTRGEEEKSEEAA